MSIYEKHNNFTKKTLMSNTKVELVNYTLMLQENLIKMQEDIDRQYENSKKIIEFLENGVELQSRVIEKAREEGFEI